MRPQSELRIALSAALIEGGGTTRELARRTNAGRTLAMYTLRDMVRAGDARVARMVRVPGCKRPVPYYERAIRQPDQAPRHQALQSLISMWVLPQHARMAEGGAVP